LSQRSKVVIHSFEGCKSCETAKTFCQDHKIEFEERVYPTEEFEENVGSSFAPVIEVSGLRITGFNEEAAEVVLEATREGFGRKIKGIYEGYL